MTPAGIRRGDGVGIEYTETMLRGVRLDHQQPDRVDAIAEVPVAAPDDEHSLHDAFVRLRGELGNPAAPTRIGTFPPGASLQRVDTTGLSGPELNLLRSELERETDLASTVLVDEGPRRWMVTLWWDADPIRRIEEIAERAGFVDVAVDPSPLALCRVVSARTTWMRRDAADGEAFRVVVHNGVPVASISDDTIGRVHPNLRLDTGSISTGLFGIHLDPGDLAAVMQRIADGLTEPIDDAPELILGELTYPAYPPHDIRSGERQCVALGAAVGAAGLSGQLRPVDMLLPPQQPDEAERPWVIERLTDLPAEKAAAWIGSLKRVSTRVLPSRRSRRD